MANTFETLRVVRGLSVGLAAVALMGISISASAVPAFTFTSPDAPLPSSPGNGLNASIWSEGDLAGIDTLAQARVFITTTQPVADATFVASTIDYPSGADATVSTSTTIGSVLGGDATSLTSAGAGATTVAANDVLNSIWRFTGLLGVETAGSALLSIPSDDGSELIIQGTQVIDNDGIHPFSSPVVEVAFSQPGLYELEMLFFESQAVAFGVEFRADGALVPQSRLYRTTDIITPVAEPLTVALIGLGLMLSAVTERHRFAHRKRLDPTAA